MSNQVMLFENIKDTRLERCERFEFRDLSDLYLKMLADVKSVQDKLKNSCFSVSAYKEDKELTYLKAPNNMNVKANNNCAYATLAVVDFDEGTLEQFNKIKENLSDFAYIEYNSFSHMPDKGLIKKRLILELETPVSLSKYKAFMSVFNFLYCDGLNPSECQRYSQAFFSPADNSVTGVKCELMFHEGKKLTVDKGFSIASGVSDADEEIFSAYNVDLSGVNRRVVPKEDILAFAEGVISEYKEQYGPEPVNMPQRDFDRYEVATRLAETVGTGRFDTTGPLGNHACLLRQATMIGHNFPDADLEHIIPLFLDNPKYGAYAVTKDVTDGFISGSRYIVANKYESVEEFNLASSLDIGEILEQRPRAKLSDISEGILKRCSYMGISPREFVKYLVIAYGSEYLVYDPKFDKYIRFSKANIVNTIQERLDGVDLVGKGSAMSVMYPTKKGVALKNITDIMLTNGKVTNQMQGFVNGEYDYEFFDPKTGIFMNKLLKPRDIEPKYDAKVDGWLKNLCNLNEELYQDLRKWISISLSLDRPLSALYIAGSPSAGKSLFASIVSRNWTVEGATPASRVLGQEFNKQLIECPLVFADEHLPKRVPQGDISDVIRDFITEDKPTIREMRMNAYKISGYMRLMMAANNSDMLNLPDDLKEADIEAIAMRFFYFSTGKLAGEYLQRLNDVDSSILDSWKSGDVAIAHFRWIRENTDLGKKFERFGVSRGVDYIKQIIKTGGLGGEILTVLINFLSHSPQEMIQYSNEGLFVSNNKLWATAKGVSEVWTTLSSGGKKPRLALLSERLASYSTSNRKGKQEYGKKRVRAFSINTKVIMDHCNKTGLSDPETILLGLGFDQAAIDSIKLERKS